MAISRFLPDNFTRTLSISLLHRLQSYSTPTSLTWEPLGHCLGQWVCCLQNSSTSGPSSEDPGQNSLNCSPLWLFSSSLGLCHILTSFPFWLDFYWGCCVPWDCCPTSASRDIKPCVGLQWQLFLFHWSSPSFLSCFMFSIGFNSWRTASSVSLSTVILILKICASYSISFGIFFNVRFSYLRI